MYKRQLDDASSLSWKDSIAHRPTAVSYTHLDVYKRQEMPSVKSEKAISLYLDVEKKIDCLV